MKYKYTTAWSNIREKYVLSHIVRAEEALGKRLPTGAQVHHVLGKLVICPSQAYHRLLHTREKALESCGDANYRKCSVCKQYDSIKKLVLAKKASHSEGQFYHRACKAQQRRERYHANK